MGMRQGLAGMGNGMRLIGMSTGYGLEAMVERWNGYRLIGSV